MKLLAEISERSLGLSDAEILEETFRFRKSARAVLLNQKDEVSIQYVGRWDYYKLPGGGVEIGEGVEEALRREVIEEVGCDLQIIESLGVTIEYRSQQELLHLSHGYLCRVDGEIEGPAYEPGELADQFTPMWKTLDESIELMKNNRPTEPYQAPFIVAREQAFLEAAKEVLSTQ